MGLYALLIRFQTVWTFCIASAPSQSKTSTDTVNTFVLWCCPRTLVMNDKVLFFHFFSMKRLNTHAIAHTSLASCPSKPFHHLDDFLLIQKSYVNKWIKHKHIKQTITHEVVFHFFQNNHFFWSRFLYPKPLPGLALPRPRDRDTEAGPLVGEQTLICSCMHLAWDNTW